MQRNFIVLVAASSFVGLISVLVNCSSNNVITRHVDVQTDVDSGMDAVDSAPQDDGYNGAPSTVYPAPHPSVPQVANLGGTLITAPHVIPIFFPGYEYQSQVETYLHQLATTNTWTTGVSEYGIGALTVGDSIVLPSPAAAAVSSQQVDLAVREVAENQAKNSSDAGTPTPFDPQTIYVIFYPPTTTISDGPGNVGCQNYGGYHAGTLANLGDADAGTTPVAYAAVPTCPDFDSDIGLLGIDELTAALSHELVEAATDPFAFTDAAYAAADDDHKVWAVTLAASELGDMCTWEYPSTTLSPGITFQTSRVWSNQAALAGHDPCVPSPTEPYFAAVPDLTSSVSIPEYAASGANGAVVRGGMTKGVKLKVGESVTVDLVLYSDGPTSGPWTITPMEVQQTPSLSLSLDRPSGVNGERLHLTITRLKAKVSRQPNTILLYSSIGPVAPGNRTSIAFIYVAD